MKHSTPHPDHPRKQIFLLRDLDVSCWSHGSDVPGQIESWEKKTWEKKKTTHLYPGGGFKYVLEFSPIYLGSPTEDMMPEFTLFTTICHWKCPTLEDDFVSVLCFFLRFSEENCKIMSAAHHVRQHATPIGTFQRTEKVLDFVWANDTTTSSTAGFAMLGVCKFFLLFKNMPFKKRFLLDIFSNMPKSRG